MYKSATRCAGARNLRIPYAGDREHAYGVPRSRFPRGRSLDLAVTWQPLVPMLDFADAPKQVRPVAERREQHEAARRQNRDPILLTGDARAIDDLVAGRRLALLCKSTTSRSSSSEAKPVRFIEPSA